MSKSVVIVSRSGDGRTRKIAGSARRDDVNYLSSS